jgi:hypothetical protein
VIALTVTLAAASFVLAAPAVGAQYQRGAAYVDWANPASFFTNWEQDIVVTDNATNTFWNIRWVKVYGPAGYLGIQNFNGVNTFHFSMWGATASQTPSGGTCTTFEEQGSYGYTSGRQCRTPVGATITNRTIRLKLIKSNRTNNADYWWSAWADVEGVGGKYLGQLRAPHGGWLDFAYNFHEYFGTGAGWNGSRCVAPGPPKSAAVFGAPTISSPELSARKVARTGTSTNTCPGTDGKSIPFYDGAFTQLGDL